VRQTHLETIIYEVDGPIGRIVMNTPEKANVQTAQQVWEIEEALAWAAQDDALKVLVIKANGNGFCAGHAILDPSEMPKVYPDLKAADIGELRTERTWKAHNYDLFLWPPLRLWEFPKATIAQIHGYCLGGGTVYGYLTDLSVASDDAYFQMPLPQGFGLPGAQTMLEPWVMMNWKHTFEYLYLAPTLSAEEAKSWGLVNRVVPRDDLEATVEEWASTIARMPLTTILAIKAGVKRAWEMMGLRVHLQNSADLLTICTAASDVHEFSVRRDGLRPRQMAARQVEAAKEASK
jgi:enoyl-CoA hydratase